MSGIYPRIKSGGYLNAVAKIPGMSRDQQPIVEPLVGDLVVTYAIDMGDSYISLTPALCRQEGVDLQSLHESACLNCIELLTDIRVNSASGAHQLLIGQGMEACTILFPDLWNQISGELGTPVVAAFPHRDSVIYTSIDSAEGIETIRDFLSQFNFDDTHALSRLLFLWDGEKWQTYDP